LTAPRKLYAKGARKSSPILYIYDKSACEQLFAFSMETRIAQLLEGRSTVGVILWDSQLYKDSQLPPQVVSRRSVQLIPASQLISWIKLGA